MADNFQIVINKLDNFINKFYNNLLIRGLLLSFLLIAIIFISIVALEYLGWFSTKIRLFLFLIFIVSSLFIIIYFFTIPLFRRFHIFRPITYLHTVHVISINFPDIKDYLINLYELKKDDTNNSNLTIASIDQKVKLIQDIDFNRIITNKNLKPLYIYLVLLFFIYGFIFLIKPAIILQGSNRIVHFYNSYEKDLGFTVTIDSTVLKVEQGHDITIPIHIQGEILPKDLFLYVNGKQFLLNKLANNLYEYTFKSVLSNFSFRIINDVYRSKLFEIQVIKPLTVNKFIVKCNYPDYLNLQSDFISDITNIKVPYSSSILISANVKNCDSLFIYLNDSIRNFIRNTNFYFEYLVTENINYSIVGNNNQTSKKLLENASINYIPDLYPTIEIQKLVDKNNSNIFYFKGLISDDYGFNKLKFHINTDSVIVIPINKNINLQEFYFVYDFSNDKVNDLTYYFEIFDNDYLNGFKSTSSKIYRFKKPTFQELRDSSNSNQLAMELNMEKSLLKVDELLRYIKEGKRKLINESLSNFEKKNLIDDILSKQNQLENILNQINKDNLLNSKLNKNMDVLSTEILKKQDAINKLFDQIMDDEFKRLLNQLKKLENNFNEQEFNKVVEKLDLNYKDLEKQLDRNMELLKKFNVEKNIELLSKEIEKVAKQEFDQLNNLKDIFNSDSISKIYFNELDKFNTIRINSDSLLQSNQELKNPFSIDEDLKDLNSLFNEFIDSTKFENNNNELSKKLKESSKRLDRISKNLLEEIKSSSEKENAENAETLRQILENLFYFSFAQETIINGMLSINSSSPLFSDFSFQQKKLAFNFEIIRDSLYAVSKRTPYLGTHISKKVFLIQNYLAEINDLLLSNTYNQGKLKQRYILENSNDLILLLSESLKNMESNGSGSGSSRSKGKRNKPNKGEPSLSELRKSQESIKKQLEQMIQEMKNGNNPGNQGDSQALGKMLAQQEVFQNMLNQLRSNSNVGSQLIKKLDEINNLLEQNKRDIIRKNLNSQTINRQNLIVTRLLEIEKSENERDLDDKRESKLGNVYNLSNPNLMFESDEEFINFEDIFIKSSLQLKPYYKNKYQGYLNKLKEKPNEKGN